MARLRRSRLYARDIDSKPAELHRLRPETMAAFLEQMDSRYGGVVPLAGRSRLQRRRPACPARRSSGQALEREGRDDAQLHVPVAGVPAMTVTSQGTLAASSRCRAARSSVVSSDIAAHRRVVVDHRGHDGQVLAMIEELDHPGLARPVDHRAGGDLPEPARRVGRVTARADRVGVRMAVQPQHHVGEPVQQGQQVGRAEQRLAVRPGVPAAGVVSVSVPWWENRITSRSSWPVWTSVPSGPR